MRSAQPGSLSCCCSLTLLLADYAAGLERNSQLCIYKDGKPVVDLWGENHAFSTAPESGYDGDTLQIVYSSTKALAAAVFALAADQGLFKYDDTVASIWPEFAQNGKQRMTIVRGAPAGREAPPASPGRVPGGDRLESDEEEDARELRVVALPPGRR